MAIEDKLEKVEKELQNLRKLISLAEDPIVERRNVKLRGMAKIVSENELEESIKEAKKSVFKAFNS
ncbi:MAG: hypothetical protein DRG31_06270 [Deltaproteobacteria bacterium]|nr:MAG: hypothetical protein DRG31_06270 [Deltaproteobacteria bacterium]